MMRQGEAGIDRPIRKAIEAVKEGVQQTSKLHTLSLPSIADIGKLNLSLSIDCREIESVLKPQKETF